MLVYMKGYIKCVLIFFLYIFFVSGTSILIIATDENTVIRGNSLTQFTKKYS